MRARMLLRLYPSRWRARYGTEMEDLLADQALTPRLALDLLRGALDAHLHPELVGPVLAASSGVTFPIGSHGPTPALVASVTFLATVLTGALIWDLSLPTPVVPLFVPIGAHASPEAVAHSKWPMLPIRLSAEKDGVGAVLVGGWSEGVLVVSSRTPTLGWREESGGSSGLSVNSPTSPDFPVPQEHPMTFSMNIGSNNEHRWMALSGQARAEVASVEVIFSDGSREELPVRGGAFLWFDVRPGGPLVRAMPKNSAWLFDFTRSAFGRVPAELVARGANGAVLDRLNLHLLK